MKQDYLELFNKVVDVFNEWKENFNVLQFENISKLDTESINKFQKQYSLISHNKL